IHLIDNDQFTMRDALVAACAKADQVRIAVAFTKGSGLAAAPALEQLAARGGTVRLIAGVDFQLTDLAAIERFNRPPSAARIFVSAQQGDRAVFHRKVYLLESRNE